MSSIEADRRRLYASIAVDYGAIESTVPYYHRLQDAAAKFVTDRPHDGEVLRVLDIGTGTGTTIQALVRQTKRLRITSIDNVPQMIAAARQRLGREQDDGIVEFCCVDALEFVSSCADDSYDAIISGFTLHNFPAGYRRDLLVEVLRLLRPGAGFANADKYVPDDPERRAEAAAVQLARIAETLTSLGRIDLLPGWLQHYMQDLAPSRAMPRELAVVEMTEIGFRSIEMLQVENMEAVVSAKKAVLLGECGPVAYPS